MLRTIRHRHALTLIELLVVMMILVILAGSITLYVVNKADQARAARAKADLATVEQALSAYHITMGEYPTSEEGLMALWQCPSGEDEERWHKGGPFITKKNYNDPWGNEYIYHAPGSDDHDYDVLCLGSDGREGGEGKNADISIWDVEGGKAP
ncbi:MAG: type II secretion system major pseudopilin GspG [Armatimonadetes bacterium]|nr:type II secretion system major pseudopilin GspG [Armatimonadota bacterium]